ncbi:MAG: baseplate J/gp47 family protein [Rhodospirillaceae bacterium]|nr:baseplate J/gp47 family protein [Rhodospirillales bacterium]
MAEAVDLSQLAAPDVVETLDYEVILAARVAKMKEELAAAGILPDWDPSLESDTIVKLLQESAYREMIMRGRINDAARAVMLAFSTGTNLDHLAAFYGVARLPGENHDRLRMRAQMALEGFTTAGPKKAYRFHALSADVRVKDVSVTSPQPGDVMITVLSTDGDGTASIDLQAIVLAALDDEEIRPLCDTVLVQSATIIPYQITAALRLFSGPDEAAILAAAETKARKYADTCHALGALVAMSGLDAALHQTGVEKVNLSLPAAEIAPDSVTAAYCTAITVSKADG